jgi:hypothetical protein
MVRGAMGLAAASRRRDAKKLVAKTILGVEPGEVHNVSRTMHWYINRPLTCRQAGYIETRTSKLRIVCFKHLGRKK